MKWIIPFIITLFFTSTNYAQTLAITVGNETGSPGDTVSVDVKVDNYNCLVTSQFSLDWNASIVQYIGVSNFGLPLMSVSNFATTTSSLSMSWDDVTFTGVTLANGTTIFSMDFILLGAAGTSSNINFVNAPTPYEAAVCGTFQTVNANLNNGSVTINSSSGMIVTSTTTNVDCNGASTGSIDLTVTGGISPYSYLWSNNATTEDLTNIPAGTYSCIITDSSSQTILSGNIVVGEPAAISGTTSITNVSCNSGADGSINLSVSGGTGSYTYAWSNAAITQNLTGLPAGIYSVTITDGNSCTKTVSNISVSEPTAISETTSITNVSCNGGANGSINLSVSGGTGSYTYAWNNAAITQNLTGLPAGIYSVTITDANNCTKTISNISVSEPTAILGTTSITNVSLCNGNANGSINLSVSGGTGGYTYAWSNAAITQNLTGLSAGTYSVTITDANS